MNTKPAAVFQPKTIQPTEEQLVIQTASNRTILVEANAGAAKTTTLALRMAESWKRGVTPERFLALTYTQTACDALKSALKKIGLSHSVVNSFHIQTFEAFCGNVLNEIHGTAVPVLAQDEQLAKAVWQAVERVEKNEGERWRSELIMPTLGDTGMVEDFLRLNKRLKGTMRDTLERLGHPVTPDYAASIGVEYTQLKIFLAYERLRRRENADRPLFRGPSDATYDLARLIYEDEPLDGLKSWPFGTKVLMVDEMHDLNQATFRVLQELLNTTSSFFCGVGDIDQVLHETAGADSFFMGTALESFTQRSVRRYPLTHSYRFGNALATKAGRIAEKPYSSQSKYETKVSLIGYETRDHCVRLVVDAALHWQQQPKAKMREFAILLRHSHQSVHIENALLENELPYTMSGLDSYLMRPEVLFIRGLLAVATDNIASVANEQTRAKVMQALLMFSRSRIEVIGRENESQEDLLASAIKTVRDVPRFLLDFFENQVLKTADRTMRRRLEEAVKIAREPSSTDPLAAMLDVLQLETLVNEVFVSKQRRQDAMGNLEGLRLASQGFESASAYFQSLNDAEQKQHRLKNPDNLVIASTVHVKGLEFDHVVMPYLAHGEFPAASSAQGEEQNLFYVGMTRARFHLTMLASTRAPSSFVNKMGYRLNSTR